MTEAVSSLAAIGYDAHFASALAALGGDLTPARIAIAHGESYVAWSERGVCKAVLAGKNITFVGSQTSMNAPNTVQNRTFPKQHEGHDGYTIDTGSGSSGISGSITDQAMANYHPNIVLLMIGTNDVNGNIDVANAPTRLGKLIDEITIDSPTALVVVASIIPINGTNNKNAMTYNAAIPGLVSTRATAGKHVIFVDNYAAFAKDPNYTTSEMSNYLHPNTAGYAVLGDSFYGAISAHLP